MSSSLIDAAEAAVVAHFATQLAGRLDRQPPPGPCEHVEREARRTGGRLLYMPGP